MSIVQYRRYTTTTLPKNNKFTEAIRAVIDVELLKISEYDLSSIKLSYEEIYQWQYTSHAKTIGISDEVLLSWLLRRVGRLKVGGYFHVATPNTFLVVHKRRNVVSVISCAAAQWIEKVKEGHRLLVIEPFALQDYWKKPRR